MRNSVAGCVAMAITWMICGSASAQASRWAEAPSGDELKAAFPERAVREHMSGEALVVCRHDAEGHLTNCKVQFETPGGYGFGPAILALTAKYRLRLDSATPPPSQVLLPTFFAAPGPIPPAREAAYQTPSPRFAWLAPAGPYWPDRALRAGIGGRSSIDCRVAAAGRLTDCRPAFDEPVGAGFLDVALLMAQRGWMTAGPLPAGAIEAPGDYWRFDVPFPAKQLCDDPAFPGSRLNCRAMMKAPSARGSSS